jgi:hypothetical protein
MSDGHYHFVNSKLVPPQQQSSNNNNEDWSRWSMYVLRELDRQNNNLESLRKVVSEQNVAIAKLNVKAGIWGIMGGAISGLVALIMWFMKSQG